MSSPTSPDLPAEMRTVPARKIQPLVWILGGTGLLLVCATLTVGFFAIRAVKNAGFAFRFDPARKTLLMTRGDSKVVMTGGESKEVKLAGGGDGKPALGMAAGLLRFENWHIERKVLGCGDQTDGCDHTEYDYVEVLGGPESARARINAAIAACVTDAASATEPGSDGAVAAEAAWEDLEKSLTPGATLQDLIYARIRKSSLQDFDIDSDPQPPPFFATTTSSVSAEVLRNAAPVFSVECRYSFSGGVHPMSFSRYFNFDPASGEQVKLASVLKEGAMARLTAVGEVHFRQERKLAATGKLEDQGFGFPDGFALNDNYGFGEKALFFLFNDNEIAPHFMGPTLVEIPYAEIRN